VLGSPIAADLGRYHGVQRWRQVRRQSPPLSGRLAKSARRFGQRWSGLVSRALAIAYKLTR
jgi:hypothetical protein